MGDWKDFPLPDGSYSDDARPWTQQDVYGYLPTFTEQGGSLSRIKYVLAPGLQTFAEVGDGPHRGARDVEGKAFVVSGNKLYQVSTLGVATELGTIPGTGRVSMTHNQVEGGNQLVIGTGDNSYVWDTSDSTLTATGVGLASVDFLNQLVIGIEPQRRFFRYSGLADATTWNDLDNESAESSPDRIVGAIVSQGEYLVFGERTIEVWQHNPTDSTQFQRTVVIEKGCANANTICRLDNSVFFLGNDHILYRLQGYTPVPVSKKAHSGAFRDSSPTKAFAFTYEDRGYVVYYLTHQDGHTWGYDVTNQRFHRRESFGLDRWRLNTLFKWNGEWYGGDYVNGKLYRLRWRYPYEGVAVLPRGFRSGVLHSNGNRVNIPGFRLLVESGREEVEAIPLEESIGVSGDLPDGLVGDSGTLQYVVTGGIGAITLEVVGELPPGATMNASGLVTYTYTTPGSYSWTIRATDEEGNVATVDDTADVAALVWWLTTTNTSSDHVARIWESDDNLATWPLTGVRTTNNSGSPSFGAIMVSPGVALVCGNTTNLDRITDFDSSGGYTTTAIPLTVTANAATLIRSFGQVVVVVMRSPGGTNKYFTSNNWGATFTERTSPNTTPGSTGLRDIARITLPDDTIRWIATHDDSANSSFIYSNDQGEPVTWINATQPGIASGNKTAVISCNGTAAATVAVGGGARTTDGITWTATSAPGGALGNSDYDSFTSDDLFITSELGGAAYFRSTDAGVNWTRITGQPQFQRYQYVNGRLVASVGQAAAGLAAKYSDDLGLTWTALPVYPYSVANGDSVRVVRMAYTP